MAFPLDDHLTDDLGIIKDNAKTQKGIQTRPYQNNKIKSILSDLVLKTKI